MRKKLTKLLVVVLVMTLALGSVSAFAITDRENEEFNYYAEKLNGLGLFLGTGTSYAVEKELKRADAAIMLVRLLGKEAEALACDFTHPFTDVPSYADRYIAYMYENELTKGSSATKFGTGKCDAKMFTTFVLRALGYSDADGDFEYSQAVAFARMISLVDSDQYIRLTKETFLRGDAAAISFSALFTTLRNDNTLLLEKLMSENAVPKDKAQFYLDVIEATELENYAYYRNVEKGSVAYKTTENIDFAVAGYTSQNLKVIADFESSEIFTNPREHLKVTQQYYGSSFSYDVYYADGYLYFDVEGDRYKEVADTSNPYVEDDSPFATIFDDYTSLTIKDENGKTTVSSVLADSAAKSVAAGALSWLENDFAALDESEYILTIKSATRQVVINSEGYLEKVANVVEFEYMLLSDGIRCTVTYETVDEYQKQGQAFTISLPDFSGFELAA